MAFLSYMNVISICLCKTKAEPIEDQLLLTWYHKLKVSPVSENYSVDRGFFLYVSETDNIKHIHRKLFFPIRAKLMYKNNW